MDFAAAFASPPDHYDLDDANLGIKIQKYLNDVLDDCVIAARAHHTIRLVYSPGLPPLAISDEEVRIEYDNESHGGGGIVLSDSLEEWKNHGWTAGGVAGRKIASFSEPLTFVNSDALLSDMPNAVTKPHFKSLIIQSIGVQANLLLPESIDARIPGSYGPGVLWDDAADLPMNSHAMLLTGYEPEGPIGITWGKKQYMTWEFLDRYKAGLFVVDKGHDT